VVRLIDYRWFHKTGKSNCLLRRLSVCPPALSVRPRGTTRIPLNGFLWSFICQNFSKI